METLIVCILMEISSGAQSSGRFLELVAAKEDHNICHHPHHHQKFCQIIILIIILIIIFAILNCTI